MAKLVLLLDVPVVVGGCKLGRFAAIVLRSLACVVASILVRHITKLGALKHVDTTASLDKLGLHLTIILLIPVVVFLDQELLSFFLLQGTLPLHLLFPHSGRPRRTAAR